MDRHSDIIAACKKLAADGMDRGASGNVSVRDGDKMMITPSAVGCDVIQPELIASMALASKDGDCTEPNKPSSEWQFHSNILRAPPDINAVVHSHAPYSYIPLPHPHYSYIPLPHAPYSYIPLPHPPYSYIPLSRTLFIHPTPT
ncbi:MAG: class II aldolase/adducin family protein, partial [Paracoccaceae bacterium]